MKEIICLIMFEIYALGICAWLYKDRKTLNRPATEKDKIIAAILLVAGYILANAFVFILG